MSDAFEEYHRVKEEDGTEKVVFMSWAAYWDPDLGALVRGPMLRLEVYDPDPEFVPQTLSPLNTGETHARHADPETQPGLLAEWLKRERL